MKNSPLSDKQNTNSYRPDTKLIHGPMRSGAWEYGHPLVAPISTSTTFRLDSTYRGAQGFQEYAQGHEDDHNIYIYDRLREPNKDMLEERLAIAEEGETAVSFSSGMGAISAILGILLQNGDHLISHHAVYGCTHSLISNWLPRQGISVSKLDLSDKAVWMPEITDKTRVIYFESPVNPTMEILDIVDISAEVAKINAGRPAENRIYIVVDNTFATPYCQRPITLGADFVVHSLTKGISGFGTDMGGVVIGPKSHYGQLLMFRKDFGAVLAPRSAWSILTYGLPTLAIRMKQAQQSALEVARFLNAHPAVDMIAYPGLPEYKGYEIARKQMSNFDGTFSPGAMLYFTLKGDTPAGQQEAGMTLMNYLAENAYSITLAVSLGNIKTLVEHPSSMTHVTIPPAEQMASGINPGGIRLAIGLETAEDLIADLTHALTAIESYEKAKVKV